MAEVFAPFLIIRTIRNLTFYSMEGRNFVRKKSRLTRRKVLYSSQFAHTRHYAGLLQQLTALVIQLLRDEWDEATILAELLGG